MSNSKPSETWKVREDGELQLEGRGFDHGRSLQRVLIILRCAAVRRSRLGTLRAGELAIFKRSNDAIDFRVDVDTDFVLGSAAPHAHDLVLGQYSVHTSAATLR